MPTISIVISAFNEEKKIEQCLKSVRWADEVILIDSSSTDKTVTIAKKFTTHVYTRPNHQMLNINKNFGFEKATSDWILSLDADEVITPELAEEIRQKTRNPKPEIRNPNIVGYWIQRKNIIFGKWIRHGLWWPDRQLRLFRKGMGKFPCVHVHEYIRVDGKTENLEEPYIHYNYETVSQYLRKLDAIYTESEVQKLTSAGYTLSWYDAIRFPASDFMKIYFAQHGYRDGLHGLVLSLMQAFYSFVVFAKFWETQQFREMDVPISLVSDELRRTGKEINYWDLTVRMSESKQLISHFLLKLKRFIVAHG